MLLALFLIRTNIGFCAAPTLSWSDDAGLWNDGVTPDYGIVSSDFFTFKVIYTDSENDAPYAGYPKVHILQGGTAVYGSPFTMTQETGCGLPYCGNGYTDGERYYYTTTLSSAGNDYTYYFEAYDSESVKAGFSSPTNEHTLTVVSGYVWVDPGGTDNGSCGTQGSPCRTIAYGISRATSGQAVRVKAGTYTGNLTMASGKHLVSDNGSSGDSETTYNDSYSSYSTSMLTRTGRTKINGIITFPNTITAEVALDGFTVYTNAGGNTVMDIQGKSPIVRNNIAYWSSTGGTYVLKMDATTSGTHEPIIENNLFHRSNTRVIGVGTYTSPIIQDNEIWAAATYPGIGLNRKGVPGGEITILNNHIFDCGGPGIGSNALAKDTTVTIQGNSIHDNGFDSTVAGKPLGAGISLARSGLPGTDTEPLEVIIGGPEPSQGNEIYNSTLAGIILDSNNAGIFPILIQNNDIYDNGKAGIVLIDAGIQYDPTGPPPPNDPIIAEVLDNTIHGHINTTGILIGGATYADIAYNTIYDNYSGIAFNMASLAVDPDPPSSGTVNIEVNDIYGNTMAGIAVLDSITGDVIIAGNEVHENYRGGITIRNSCENLFINRNEIHDNYRGGIHTGGVFDLENDYFANSNDECIAAYDPYPCCTGSGTGTCNSTTGFIGNTDSAFLDVSQNKVYGNGLNDIGGGIDIRHASGSIYNNLVYENAMGGIRYGNYIYEIINNTVVDNGIGSLGRGGGIIYDSLDGYVADIPSGDGPLIPIRNNIVAFHPKAGIRTEGGGGAYVCQSDDYRDYNLLIGNNNTNIPPSGFPWDIRPQLGGCWLNANEIFVDPEFVDRANDDYRILVSSPAVDAGDAGYDLNTDCTEAGVPYQCCTGAGTGTCPTYDYGTGPFDMGAYGGPFPIDW